MIFGPIFDLKRSPKHQTRTQLIWLLEYLLWRNNVYYTVMVTKTEDTWIWTVGVLMISNHRLPVWLHPTPLSITFERLVFHVTLA